MVVLGVCDSQDSGAALFVHGALVAAVNEERLNRVKLWGGFPALSVAKVLEIGGVRPEDVEVVVLGTRITPNLLARAFRGIHQGLRRGSGQFGYLLNLFITYQTVARALRVPEALEATAARAVIRRDLARLGISGARLVSVDHHVAHAAGAWATAPFFSQPSPPDRALVVTVDGLGDGLGLTVSVGERGRGLRRVHAESGFSALTLYYSRLTESLGFTPIKDEGKVNALAAYTDRMPLLAEARSLLRHRDGRFNRHNHLVPASMARPPYSRFRDHPREEVAASFQQHLEDEMRAFVRHWLARTGTSHLCLAGGLFANVKLNQRLAAMPEVRGLWVFPHMGDGGLAVGGCFAFLRSDPAPFPHAYWGPGFTDTEAEAALRAAGLRFDRPGDLPAEVARLLAGGRVVARATGRMEYGPRALGHRSILVQATDPSTMDWLNRRLKRSPFMPFAPAVLDDDYDDCFVGGDRVRDAARFMTVSLDATPDFRARCPGAVHVDGTARPQRVTAEASPGFARILREYRALTGLPCVINTSFNMHEEPIVCTPADAVGAFLRSGADALALGPFLAEAPRRDGGDR